MNNIEHVLDKNNLTRDDLIKLLSLTEKENIEKLRQRSYLIKEENGGKTVYFRGLIEIGNNCEKDCFYCGIRKSNKDVNRYFMKREEIIKAAMFSYKSGYGSIVMQSGEISDPNYTIFIEKIIKDIKNMTNNELAITLSLGEQKSEVYKKWFDAGADRYLLRIETTDRNLYEKIHHKNQDFDFRMECLENLKKIGYQVGTGVMIGLPSQSLKNLADDIMFFKNIDIDMIGMGPFIPASHTPMYDSIKNFENIKKQQVELALKMIAVTRIVLKDVNIAAATALQSLDDFGREKAIMYGANVIMPNVTDIKYRKEYILYDNKPCINESKKQCKGCLESRIKKIGENIGFDKQGNSLHFLRRNQG